MTSPLGRIAKMKFSLGYRSWLLAGLAAVLAAAVCLDGTLASLLKMNSDRGRALVLIGYWLGHGAVQAIFAVLLFELGRRAGRLNLREAAARSLAAFLVSGLAVQAIKHLVGRPRPRLWARGVEHFGPSLADGLDSFPSGHATTTFAVALVLSYHYPRLSPLLLSAAAFVGASRVWGGSHFPVDVLGGALLGLITARLVTALTRPDRAPGWWRALVGRPRETRS